MCRCEKADASGLDGGALVVMSVAGCKAYVLEGIIAGSRRHGGRVLAREEGGKSVVVPVGGGR